MSLPGDLIDTAIDFVVSEKFRCKYVPMVCSAPGEQEIKTLVARLSCSDAEESKKAVWSISNLSRHPINRKTIVREKALPNLVQILKDRTDVRVPDVLRLLTNLSQTSNHRKEILYTDALSSVIALLKTGKTSLQEHSMEFVANMCLNQQAREAMIKEKGMLEVLVLYMKKVGDKHKMHVVRALMKLSVDAAVASSLLKLHIVKGIVDALMTVEDVVTKARLAKLIYHLSLDPKYLNRFGSVCVWQLLDLLDTPSDSHCKIWALKALGNLTQRSQLRRNVMKQGGIPLITSLLKTDDAVCVDEAAGCIANLTKDREKVPSCMRKGVMGVLVKLLETKSLDALRTVANISEVIDQRYTLLQSGVIPLLVRFLVTDDEHTSHRVDTLRCLAHLSDVDASISWFLQSSVITSIVQALRSPCTISCSHAAHIVMNIGRSPPGIREIVEADAIWPLVRLLKCKHPEAQLSAVKALSVVSSNRHARSKITQYDGIADLMSLMKNSNDEIRMHASKTLYELSSNLEAQRMVVNDGGISTLIGMLSSRNFEVRESALGLLIRLGLTERHWSKIKIGGGVTPMIRQLLVSEFRDTMGVCRSCVTFFNSVIFMILRGHFKAD